MTDPSEPPAGSEALRYGSRRQALIDAMIRVTARDGLRKVTYRSVAAEAGVSHGLLFYHFSSLDTLILEAFDDCIQHSMRTINFVAEDEDPTRFADGIIYSLNTNPDSMEYQYQVLLESRRNSMLTAAVDLMFVRYRRAVGMGLANMNIVPDSSVSSYVFSIIEGIVLHQHVENNPAIAESSVQLLRMTLNTLRQESQKGAST